MKIQFYAKDVFGNCRTYIADPDVAKLVQDLTGQKTFNMTHRIALEKLGHTFERVFEPVTAQFQGRFVG